MSTRRNNKSFSVESICHELRDLWTRASAKCRQSNTLSTIKKVPKLRPSAPYLNPELRNSEI